MGESGDGMEGGLNSTSVLGCWGGGEEGCVCVCVCVCVRVMMGVHASGKLGWVGDKWYVPGMTMHASVSTLFCFQGPLVNSLSRKDIS